MSRSDVVYVRAQLPSGAVISVPVHQDATDVAFLDRTAFAAVFDNVREVAQQLKEAAAAAAPDSVGVTIGVGFEVKSGKLSALLLESGANASVQLTMTWERPETSA